MHDFICYRLYLRFDGLLFCLLALVLSLAFSLAHSLTPLPKMPHGIPFAPAAKYLVALSFSVFHIHAYPARDLYANDVDGSGGGGDGGGGSVLD